MVNFVFIGLIIAAVFLFFKITSFRYERWWTYLIGVLIVFILFSFFNVIRANNIDVNSFEGFMSGAKVYFYWLVNFGKNTAAVTGHTVFNWNMTNSTN